METENKTAEEVILSLKNTYYDEYLQCKTVPLITAVQSMEIYADIKVKEFKDRLMDNVIKLQLTHIGDYESLHRKQTLFLLKK